MLKFMAGVSPQSSISPHLIMAGFSLDALSDLLSQSQHMCSVRDEIISPLISLQHDYRIMTSEHGAYVLFFFLSKAQPLKCSSRKGNVQLVALLKLTI